ncbi:MAG: DHH family phosphoesterase [Clostridia bacterium]|nr:DHH family phosphoesterase [Clostridia bacterium]
MSLKHDNIKSKLFHWEAIVSLICASVFLGLLSLWTPTEDTNRTFVAICLILTYLAVNLTLLVVVRLIRKKNMPSKTLTPVMGTIMLDAVLKSSAPAMICDSYGKIIWHNRVTSILSPVRASLYGTKAEKLFNVSIDKILRDESNVGVFASVGDRSYRIKGYRIKAGERSYVLLMFTDVTEATYLSRQIAANDIVCAYIIVDNLEEMLQFEQEKYRQATAAIDTLLREWVASVGGILKEYERDKYFFIFKSSDLDRFIADKFDILDKIREINIGVGNIPITVSIGAAKVTGSLADKERGAHAALDMALQRGGDQAVVKREDGIEFYGGRTNAIQKKTRVRARVISNELVSHMTRAGNVLIMAHRFPDFDAIGASIGVARLAIHCGVKVNIVTNPQDVNVRRVLSLYSGDSPYKDLFVDGSRGMDLIRSDTLLVIVDANNAAVYECAELADNVENIVIIDHHRKTAEFKKTPLISYIEPSASSACELVAEMLEQVIPTGMLKSEDANALLSGILLDTKQFTKATGTKTFSAALYLRDEGASPSEVQDLFKTTLDDFMREAKFGTNVSIYRDCMAISQNDGEGTGSDRISAAKVADKLLTVEGVAASFALVRIGNAIHISARSGGTVNVQLILEKLNGGGHFDSAGAQVSDGNMHDAVVRLKSAIDSYLMPDSED